MDKADHHYKSLCQQAHYSDLSTIEQKLISKYDQHKNPFDVYFFYSMFQEKGPKTILYFVQKIPRYTHHDEGQTNHTPSYILMKGSPTIYSMTSKAC